MGFPKDFVWGASAAAYQVEGAAYEDGRGLSVWEMFNRTPGKVFEGHTGDDASCHYKHYKEDVGIMKEIGLHAYRMSIAWPRVLPTGTGKVNPKGLDFYNKLIDELLAKGIEPYVTIFHWDYPYDLYCRGGWLNPDSSDWFADYTKVVVDALSDRVTKWMTINEPQVFIGLGHQLGLHAPGDKLGRAEVLLASHNTLLAHGKSAQVIRANAKKKPLVGFAPASSNYIPASDDAADIDAARNRMFGVGSNVGGDNAFWMDPVYLGKYPDATLDAWGKDMPEIKQGDMETIHQPLDFFGVNVYNGSTVKASKDSPLGEILPRPRGYGITTYRWPVTPEALYWSPRFFHERYQKPVYITENGLGNMDWIHLDGKVHDPQRIDFLARYLRCLAKACDDGIPIKGYFTWSIMDNFEWNEGYSQRFGIVYVDYQTEKRILKDSAHWYKEVIATNGAHALKG